VASVSRSTIQGAGTAVDTARIGARTQIVSTARARGVVFEPPAEESATASSTFEFTAGGTDSGRWIWNVNVTVAASEGGNSFTGAPNVEWSCGATGGVSLPGRFVLPDNGGSTWSAADSRSPFGGGTLAVNVEVLDYALDAGVADLSTVVTVTAHQL
jgi:hypothetical protein